MNNDFDKIDTVALKKAEEVLTRRVLKTQAEIRRVDLFAAICAFVTLALALLLFGIVLDCWILPNGLSIQGRVYYAIIGIISALLFFISQLVPIFLRRVNILFAAKELETAWEDKHNFIINWLQLCKFGGQSSRDEADSPIRQQVLEGVVLQAANNAKVQSETVVDYTKLIRWGIAFTVVVALFSGYLVFSPKNPFTGTLRIVAPLANIERPQALNFKTITPGNVVAYQGDFLDIGAEIPGASDSSPVELLYSSADGRLVDVAVPMESSGNSKFHIKFPGDQVGLTENLTYRIVVERGVRTESCSDSYNIEVRPLPSFRVEKVTLTFPEYTGLAKQSFENQGDIRALEGTQVSIIARCNANLERASFLPDGQEPRAQKMRVDDANPQLAAIDFRLEWEKENNSANEVASSPKQLFSFYQLISHDVEGQKNRDSRDYSVSIIADLPPTIRWESAPDGIAEVPLNDVLHLKLAAEDPDFSLRSISMMFAFRDLNENGALPTRPNLKPIDIPLSSSPKLDYSSGPTPYVGINYIACELSPKELELSVGDEIEYWAVAYDSKEPNPNIGVSEKRIFVVIDPVANPSGVNSQDQESENEAQEPDNSQTGSQEGAEESSNEQKESQSGVGEDADERQNPNSSDTEEKNAENQGEESGKSETTNNNQGETKEGSGDSSESSGNEDSEQSNQTRPNDNSDETSGMTQTPSSSQGEQDASNGPNEQDSSSNQDSPSQDSANSNQTSQEGSDSSLQEPSTPQSELPDNQLSSASVDPTEAFEKILDYMKEIETSDSGESKENTGSDENEQTSNSSGSASGTSDATDPLKDDNNRENYREPEEEVEPDFNSESNIPPPNEKRELPTRTSSQKPAENSESFQAENPNKIDPNASRREDELNEDTNNFLAQNPESNVPLKNNNNSDANILLDPLDQSQATAADSVNSSAPEAQGASKLDLPEGPFEIDQQQSDDTARSNSPRSNIDKNQLPEGNFENENSEYNQDFENSSSESNTEEDSRKTTKPNQNQPSSEGSSNEDNERQRGAGGTGIGETGANRQTLALADAPKLQYAEQATNLVLEYLEDSLKDKIDRDLLDELGWTEEQLRDFLRRWQKMRNEAEKGNEQDLAVYLKALEVTKLSPQDFETEEDVLPMERRSPSTKGPQSYSANEAVRFKTPDRLTERVRAFTQGVSQGIEK
ncbi:MAG: hypothetical protein PHO46_06345 [Thermoguttaceae bacterium]|nr:hypothetical protein [Thermoguttaceae bacterium]